MVRRALVIAGLLASSCASGQDAPAPGTPDGRLFLKLLRGDGEPVVALDPTTGRERVVPFSRRARGDPPFQLAVTSGSLVLYGARRSSQSQGVYAANVERPMRRPRLLGRPTYFVPSATDGRVWFLRSGSLTERTVPDGRVIVRGGRPPCRGPSTLAAVEGALLCQARTELRAFDPASGRVLMRLPGPFPAATAGRLVAWCTQACRRVRVTDVHGDRTMAIGPGAGFELEASYDGASSPDLSLLAVPALERRDPLAPRRRVALIDLRARRSRLIPGSRLGGYRRLAWTASGDWLVFTAGANRLMAWRRGSERAVPLPLEVRGTITHLATSR